MEQVKMLKKAFEDGCLYDANELELKTDGRETAFEVWYEDVFLPWQAKQE